MQNMQTLSHRHTFHYLDVPHLDNAFKEMDVFTYMIEEDQTRRAARAVYQSARSVAVAVQIAAFAALTALNLISDAIDALWASGKKTIVLFIKSPNAARKRFFPTKEELLEQRMESLNKALKGRHVTVDQIAGQLSHEEKTELMVAWLKETLGADPKEPLLKELCDLMEQIASRDVAENLWEKAKERVEEIFKEDATLVRRFAGIRSFTTTFILIFDKEKKFEENLNTNTIEKDFSILLKHPNLLKREDVAAIIHHAPAPLQDKIVRKKNEVMQRALAHCHAEEKKFLATLTKLKPLTEQDLNTAYISQAEVDYLDKRIQLVDQRIAELNAANPQEKSFEQRFFEFEKYQLEQQQDKKQQATDALPAIIGQLAQANHAVDEHAATICAQLHKRITAALSDLSAKGHDVSTVQSKYQTLSQANWQEYFREASLVCSELERLEMKWIEQGTGTSAYLNRMCQALVDYDTYRSKMKVVQEEAEPWKTLNSLATVAQREEERETNFAKDVIRLSMEMKPECQLPLLQSKQDARTLAKLRASRHAAQPDACEAKAKIAKAAQEFVQAVQDKHCERFKALLLSFTEFAADLRSGTQLPVIAPVEQGQEELEKKGHNFTSLARELKLTEELNHWHARLQEIWIEHMPREQEEAILACADAPARKKKMVELFEVWLETMTGKKLTTHLSFDRITLKSHVAERKEAIDTRLVNNSHFHVRQFADKMREKIAADKALPQEKKLQGFASDLISHAIQNSEILDPTILCRYIPFRGQAAGFEDFIAALEKARKALRNQDPGLDQSIEWALALYRNPQLKNAPAAKFIILGECKAIIEESFAKKVKVPDEIQEIYLKMNKTEKNGYQLYDFDRMSNKERSLFCGLFVEMFFAGGEKFTFTEKQRSHIIQMLALSALTQTEKEAILANIVIGAESNKRVSDLIEEIGRRLQVSAIQLEGVEESTLQKSFQQSNLPETPETRALLDAHRAVSNEELSLALLSYVYAKYPLDHDQGREAIARALCHAYTRHPEAVIKHVIDQMQKQRTSVFNPKTLAPPLDIFYLDILLKISPDTDCDLVFNQMLIDSKNANQMLMGYARMITYFSGKSKLKVEEFYLLLKYKMAYQNLKLNYFDGKKEIAGFLKAETDAAETAMLITAPRLREQMDDLDVIDQLKALVENERSQEFDAQLLLKTLSNCQGQRAFELTPVPGFLAFGTRIKIDCATGIVYNDGRQQINLPPHLQNHPAVISLNLQHLPYTWDARENAFVYYTKVNGRHLPQIIVKEVNGQPVIHKKLTVSFDAPNQADLQFVQKENVHLPIAVMHRMGVKSFWQEENGSVYGYDKEGNLAVSLHKGNPCTIKTKEGSYTFVNAQDLDTYKDHPVLSRLFASFNPNEILISLDKTIFYVPALGLKLKQEKDKAGEIQWATERKGLGKKILDLTRPKSSSLIFRNENNEHKAKEIRRKLKEEKYRLELDLFEGLGHLAKHQIKTQEQTIAKLQQALTVLEERTFLTTLPDDAYNENDVIEIVKLIPADLQGEFSTNPVHPPFAVYQEVLTFLNKKLSNAAAELAVRNDDKLQEEVHRWLKAYQLIQSRYEQTCDKPKEAVVFYESSDTSIVASDLTTALTIALKGMEKGVDPRQLMKELAKYSLDKPLSDSQERLLQKAIEAGLRAPDTDLQKQLNAYLHLLYYLHLTYKMQELAHAPLSDKKSAVQTLESVYAVSKHSCQNCIAQLPQNGLAKELLALWRKTQFDKENKALEEVERVDVPFIKQVNPAARDEFHVWTSHTLLERLHREDAITSLHKNPSEELSPHHVSLIRQFQKHSHDQVSGFYLEELGNFNLDGLYGEFKVDADENALYGLKKKDIATLFTFLQKANVISRPDTSTNYYYLTSVDKAMTEFPANEIRALLTHLPLSEDQLTKITSRMQSFLFRAMLSGFKFSFKEGVEKELDQELEKEKQFHLQKYLEAEVSLKKELLPFHATFGDLKYALLSDDYTKFAGHPEKLKALSNGMIRYLFHKTEVQHIENVQKAPAAGERNKIELLLTKRNYPIDLLLQEGLRGEQRKEQILQRAFLAFEEDYGFRCNVLQIKMFRSLILDTQEDEAIDAAQARMGFGKTALLPLMSIVRVALERKWPAAQKHLVRYVVPRAVIEDNTSSFNQRFSAIVGGNVIKDREFARYQIDAEKPEESFKYIIEDLKSRLTFYKETASRGNVLIQWPEIRGAMEAQDLDFGEMLVKGGMSKEVFEACLEAKRLLGEIRNIPTYTVFDELDDTQDIKSREVNFTRGDKNPIPRSTIRPLEQLLTYIDEHKWDDWKDLNARARDLLTTLCTDRQGQPIVNPAYDVIQYLTNRNVEINGPTQDLLSEDLVKNLNGAATAHTENDSMLFLIRAVLLDENILALARSKQPNTHFGARFVERDGQRVYFADPDSESTLLIAVPYEGTNTPKGLSIFDNTEVAAITTMRYYRSPETLLAIRPHLDFLIKQVQKGRIPEELSDYYLQGMVAQNGSTVIELLEQMAGMLDPEELRIAKAKFHAEFMADPSDKFRKFFAMAVVATQIKSDEACAKSDRYEKGSVDNIEKGCSGTVGGTSSYFAKQANDAAADGKLSIEIMGRDNNAVVKWLEAPDPKEDYLKSIIRTLLTNATADTRAIVDAAGMCKSRDGTPETVVAELWEQLKADAKFAAIEGIVYYGKDNVKRLYRGKTKEAIPCTTAMELAALEERKYFSFYGQKNTRGSDIKQANGAHSLVTLDENVSNSDAKQAVLRFRNLVNRDSQQTFSFAVMPSFEGILKETLLIDANKALAETQRDLAVYKDALANQKPLPGQTQFVEKDVKNGIAALVQQEEKIKQRMEAIRKMKAEEMQTKEIANFLRLQEKNREEKGALTIFRKEMKAHVKQAAAHLEEHLLAKLPKELTEEQKAAYVNFLKERSKTISFVEYSINTLFKKYGVPTTNTQRNLYIEEQRKLANERIDELFRQAGAFAAAVKTDVTLEKAFYVEHIERSIDFFKERFDEHTPVQTLHVNADGEAVAEAQAQAEAEAEATSLAEKLAEGIVEVIERFHALKLVMAADPHLEVNLDYLQDETQLTAIDAFESMKNIIRPDLRDKFKVSPFLKNNVLLASHFVLVSDDDILFITQQEAELFASEMKTKNVNEIEGYRLVDARAMKPSGTLEAQAVCAVLGDNNVPKDKIEKSEDLRHTTLTNVLSPQLLPTLAIKGPAELNEYFAQGEFGVGKDMKFTFAINPTIAPDKFQIEVQGDGFKHEIAIPTKNEIVMREIRAEYAINSVKKIEGIHKRISDELDKYLPQLKALKQKEAELEALNLKDKQTIASVKAFDLTQTMKDGMIERDSDSKTYGNDNRLKSVGVNTIDLVKRIVTIQTTLKRDPSAANLALLEEAFKELVSPEIIAKAGERGFNYITTPLFNRDAWNTRLNDLKKVPLLEQTYGRIVFGVHKGNTTHSPAEGCIVLEAQTCPKLDCKNLFAQVIPDLIKATGSINAIMAEIAKREVERKKIADEIAEIQRKYAPLLEALRVAEELVKKQAAIEKNLQEQGVYFHPGRYFDQFKLGNEAIWEAQAAAAFDAKMPDYHHVVQDMATYRLALKALTVEEAEELKKNQKFLANVMELSRTPEAREQETTRSI